MMDLVAIFYERGLEIRRFGDSWRAPHSSSGEPVEVSAPSQSVHPFGLRPVMTVRRVSLDESIDLVLTDDGAQNFGLCVSDIYRALQQAPHGFQSATSLFYTLGALSYHTAQICRRYSEVCSTFSRCAHGFGPPDPMQLFQGRGELYYEFDALVTAVRRTFDTLRYPLWQYFGPSKGSVPSSFYRTLPLCDRLSPELAVAMQLCWDSTGEAATAYRHCIQHYSPVDFGLSSIHMKRLDSNVWTAHAMIPDNPSAKSRKAFTFQRRLDALTFGWQAANDVLRIALAMCKELPRGDPSSVVGA